MKLLSPLQLKRTEQKEIVEQRKKIEKIRQEEQSFVEKLNNIKALYTKSQQELEDTHTAFCAEKEQERVELIKEVEALKRDREEQSRPIAHIKKQVEKELKEAEQAKQSYIDKIKELDEQIEKVASRLEYIADKNAELEQEERNIALRKTAIIKERLETKKQSQKVGKEWVKYYEAVNAFNARMEKESIKIKNKEAVLDVLIQETKKQEEENKKDRLAIIDGYRALEQASKHIYGKRKKRSK